jgi:DNA mismatch repair protein MSH6
MLITGPNAAGKTTLLKTTIFNIIMTQQTGFGFYQSAVFAPYDMIHCYINIPDTSGRDSLFQAEARRCKEILDKIALAEEEKKRHFCVFDELYSGTNPYEAVGSAYAFLTYLNKYKNVNFVLTTHFLDLCKRFAENKAASDIKNYQMRINTEDKDNFQYTYELIDGISTIKGGVKVLKDLQYPSEIIQAMQEVLAI